MLLDTQTKERLRDIIAQLAKAYGIHLTGVSVQSYFGTYESATHLPPLLQAYVAGKIASILGPDRLRSMSIQQLADWVSRNNLSLTEADVARLNTLVDDTKKWVNGRSNAWQAKLDQTLSVADQAWDAEVSTLEEDTPDTNVNLEEAHNAATDDLSNQVDELMQPMQDEAHRLLQTEVATFFMFGQVSNRKRDQMVYKVPRPGACPYCRKLHIAPDGSYRKYKLGDVLGHSNIGLPAGAWQFTIGPVHPHCYCVLYYEGEAGPQPQALPGGPEGEISASDFQLSVGNCDVPTDPNLIWDDQISFNLPKPHDPERATRDKILMALREAAFDN